VLIERIEIIPYALPFQEPYVTARGRLERRELALLRLRAGGLEGLGEAAPLALRGGPDLARIVSDIERCRPLLATSELTGDPRDLSGPCAAAGAGAQALLAIELAAWDLLGKSAGVPCHRLLGADPRPVRCNATLVAGPPAEVAEHARSWAALGFDTFKLKAGVDGDVDQVRAVRDAVGSGARIRVDANGAWSVDEAAHRLEAMEPLELAEQPVGTLAEMGELRARTRVRLAADESVVSVADARDAAPVCDAATVKLAKVGGIDPVFRIADELPVYLSSALDGPVGIAAAAHVALALPGELAHGLATSRLFGATVAARECAVHDGHLHLPGGLGLGVEIDDAALARHRIEPG
jgi:L-Ala-D/L-Glu epimerase